MLKFGIVSEVKPGYARVNFQQDKIVTDWLPVMVRKSKTDKESWQLDINEHVVCMMEVEVIDGKVYEECSVGVILGVIPSDVDTPDPGEGAGKFRKKFSDGTVIEYDKNTHKFSGDIKGAVEVKAIGNVIVDTTGNLDAKAAGNAAIEASGSAKLKGASISLDGPVSVSGNLTVSGTVGATGAINTGGAITATGALTAASIAAGGATMVGGVLTLTGDVIANGKSLTGHTHTAPSGGGPTSPPI